MVSNQLTNISQIKHVLKCFKRVQKPHFFHCLLAFCGSKQGSDFNAWLLRAPWVDVAAARNASVSPSPQQCFPTPSAALVWPRCHSGQKGDVKWPFWVPNGFSMDRKQPVAKLAEPCARMTDELRRLNALIEPTSFGCSLWLEHFDCKLGHAVFKRWFKCVRMGIIWNHII